MSVNSAAQFNGDILGFDIGSARIGVARIHPLVKLSEPLQPITVKKSDPIEYICKLIDEYQADAVVFGLPRNLEGEETDQTRLAQQFVKEFLAVQKNSSISYYFIDEAGTSKAADERIQGREGMSRDSVAACILLEDFVHLTDITDLKIKNLQ